MVMKQGGVQKPGKKGEKVLGKREIPRRGPGGVGARVEGGDTARLMEEMAEANAELQVAALEAADAIGEARAVAKILHGALLEVGRYVRAQEAEMTETDGLPPEVQNALGVLGALEEHEWLNRPTDGPSAYTCPECVQSKHDNCTGTVLDDADEMVPCACLSLGHAR